MTRVFVGMSGGVDSSVAAKRLLERGYEVVGVFIKVWQPDFIHCEWEKERLDAMRVAAFLNIPFLTMDAENAYKREVADYMIEAYRSGLTPNPDVMCNEHVKFGAFYTWARENGADAIATGHYALRIDTGGKATLQKGKDASKDQSYFLSRVHPEVLPNVLFPIGDTLKEDIRIEAQKASLPTATKADSQGICFLGQIDIKGFLKHYIDLDEGNVLDTHGNVVGTHDGAILYTLGQRHGYELHAKESTPHAHYVVDRDIIANTITVDDAPRIEDGAAIRLIKLNFLGSGLQNEMEAVFRYHGPSIRVRTEKRSDESVILYPLETTVHTPARGQMCVLYSGDECCGGGIIL
jgi:tRNA-uridine 2-sulfurtransferase